MKLNERIWYTAIGAPLMLIAVLANNLTSSNVNLPPLFRQS